MWKVSQGNTGYSKVLPRLEMIEHIVVSRKIKRSVSTSHNCWALDIATRWYKRCGAAPAIWFRVWQKRRVLQDSESFIRSIHTTLFDIQPRGKSSKAYQKWKQKKQDDDAVHSDVLRCYGLGMLSDDRVTIFHIHHGLCSGKNQQPAEIVGFCSLVTNMVVWNFAGCVVTEWTARFILQITLKMEAVSREKVKKNKN